MESLLRAGADTETVQEQGATCLAVAADKSKLATVKLLLRWGGGDGGLGGAQEA